MRALLSSVGTRGDVQPLIALALELRALGHQVRLCVPPNFVDWVRRFGFEAIAVGVEMRQPPGGRAPPLTAEQLQRLRESMPDLIGDQFEKVGAAAEGCAVILGANAHQYATRSIAQLLGVPCVTALYSPVALPSPDHPPPPGPGESWAPTAEAESNLRRWADNRRAWNTRALERVNHHRRARGLGPIDDVLQFNLGERPWLAADELLAPVPTTPGRTVFETGAWVLADATPLPPAVERFLEAGEPPVFFGFGSMPAPANLSRTLVEAARAVGRRAIISRGWAELETIADEPDCLVVADLNQQALFRRVAAVVHHGGAGTTATAARAGVPQVVAPFFSDQFSWASQVRALGVGAVVEGPLTGEPLTAALRAALDPAIAARSREMATHLRDDGAMIAARALVALT